MPLKFVCTINIRFVIDNGVNNKLAFQRKKMLRFVERRILFLSNISIFGK